MDRREFLARAGLVATWAGITVHIGACSDDESPTNLNDDGSSGDVSGTVTGGGHGHSGARITGAQLLTGDAVILTLTGSGHTHTVSLTADQMGQIADGQQVSVTSSTSGSHEHTVTFN